MNNPESLPLVIVEQQTWLAEHKVKTGLSWPQIALKVGVPVGTLSQFPTGAYKGDLGRIAEAVARYRQLLAAQAEIAIEMPDIPAFFETKTTRLISTMLRLAQGNPMRGGRITIIAGVPGTSKTETIKEYQATHSNVWHATMKPSTKGINTMQIKVLSALGVQDAKGTPLTLTTRIESLVRGTGGLLVIDEAQHTSELALEEIRSWHDETKIGICLVGNDDVLARLTVGKSKDAFARLASRMAQSHKILAPFDADALALADAWSVEADDQRRFLVALAKRPGGLRRCTRAMEIAVMLSRADASALTLAHLRDAAYSLPQEMLAA